MISTRDLVELPYTPDLSAAGIAYACRALPNLLESRPGAISARLPRIAAATAAELAFRRYLRECKVPFGIKRALPFTEPDRFDVVLGRRSCEIRSFLISRPRQIAALADAPELMLRAPALVPLDQYWADGQSADDLYLFTFLRGTIAAASPHVQKASGTGAPPFLVHVMPKAWSRPPTWMPLGPLALKSDSPQPHQLEIGGQDSGRDFLARSAELGPRTRLEIEDDFYSVSYVHLKSKPAGRLAIHSPARGETYVIGPGEWRNIWVQGTDISLVGWITRGEFGRRAVVIPEGSSVFQLARTRTKNLGVVMSQLKPLADLLEPLSSQDAASGTVGE